MYENGQLPFNFRVVFACVLSPNAVLTTSSQRLQHLVLEGMLRREVHLSAVPPSSQQ